VFSCISCRAELFTGFKLDTKIISNNDNRCDGSSEKVTVQVEAVVDNSVTIKEHVTHAH